jgi:tRNA A-37 threonylcarbamoyl transferase component Bud32
MSSFSPAIKEFIAAPEDTRRLGSYCCKELLDTAGTAPVFKAVEEHAGVVLREVAIKVFDIGSKTTNWQERVTSEARSLCRVQHPNVIRFHTLATDEQRGLMGLVMEFADGISLKQSLTELPRGDERRIARAVEIGVDVASALAAAHEAGIVHCNVKPSNIVFTEGTHKLINFGIAASVSKDDAPPSSRSLKKIAADSIGQKASTLEDSIVGTIGYTDPICIQTTAAPTTASDLYSLGATLYEVVAGDVPARGGEGVDQKILTGESPAKPLAEVAPSVPAALGKLVDSLVLAARDARPRSADAVRRELERIRSALTGHHRALPAEERGPFPGLDRYEAADRDVFFGRSAEIAGAVELARTRGLVALVGISGSGKSSITRAGIIPAIQDGALGGWPKTYRSVLVTPGSDLMAALDAELVKVLDAPLAKQPEAIVDQLAADVDAKGKGIVILIDQLEELVLKGKKDATALPLLSRLADANAGLRVIVAVRQDLLDEVLAIDPVFGRALSRGIQHLGPLTPTAWEEVVDQSLEAYGYGFEDATLRKDVLAELRGRAAAMTLGQFGLSRLWAARDTKKKNIPRAAFADKGGMRGALAEHAAETVAALDLPQDTLRELLLKMTTPDGAHAHVALDAVSEAEKKALFALTKARLVVSENEGFTFVHDSVLREWGLLKGWIDDARDDRLLLAHLERDAARWSESKDSAELWRKSRLAAARELWRRKTVTPSGTAHQFVTKSVNEEGKVRVAFFTLAALLIMVVVGGSLIYAKDSREHADALAAALAQVKQLKQEAEENAMEAAASAKLLHDLQKQMADERATYGANVQAAMQKVANAKTLDGAQKASQELQAQAAPAHTAAPVVPLPLNLLSSGGPSLDVSGPGPSTAGTFDQGAIERVVATRKAGVKRTCLDRGSNTASSTKITAALTIAPNGTVQNVSTTGDDPAVAKCIENQLKTWAFPAPGEVKQVQIPFVFVRQ